VRSLPLLRQSNNIKKAEAGLTYFDPQGLSDGERADHYYIIICHPSDPQHRHGWLPTDPGIFRDEFEKFRRQILSSHRLISRAS
jgi:hypothetical protein